MVSFLVQSVIPCTSAQIPNSLQIWTVISPPMTTTRGKKDQMETYQDLAMVIAWPDKTARGDERWMALLKQLRIVKNLNFKVGHAAIILINHQTGSLAYYDFGRYITPRGYGRARDAESDPRLKLFTKAQLSSQGTITNLKAILSELQQMEYATHGGGRLLFSLITGISFSASTRFAQRIIAHGPIQYGAIAKGNNSCSRFVAQVLLAGLPSRHPARKRIALPESFKASPVSNVVNAAPNGVVYCDQAGVLTMLRMTRWQSLRFQVDLLCHNLSSAKAKELPCDKKPGSMDEPVKPVQVPKSAQWLGGIGEGAWYALENSGVQDGLVLTKYAADGSEDYRVDCVASHPVNLNLPFQFTYHCHYQRHIIIQNGTQIVLETFSLPIKRTGVA
ncbi:hypothetical protein SAMN05660226_02038 [Parapedobacter luteus]|uniref:Uncharacterized protein n=2 Tax=Parapedobacter luteus TaxID=623280 RepID=A0A1T5CCI8_9SPHI|nr:hypothetical protein SAMN05660226_02038 [Parapedobacter luteus]